MAESLFKGRTLIEYISRGDDRGPHELINTETPGEVGIFRDSPDLLERGDIIEDEPEALVCLNRISSGQNDRKTTK